MSRPPDILFLMTDHQRADSIGMVQAGLAVTPHLNRLAAEGVHLTRAYTTCPLCVPARTALATGRYPTANGVVTNDWQGVTAGDYRPMHQYLADAGYRVAHLGVDHIKVQPPLRERVAFSRHLGMPEHGAWLREQGINDRPPPGESYQREVLENRGGTPVAAKYSSARAGLWSGPEAAFFDRWIGRQAIAELAEALRDQPLALFVYLWAPHPPLRVPEPWASRFPPALLTLPPNVGQTAAGEPANRRQGVAAQLAEGLSEGEWRAAWSAHLGLTALADAVLGEILAALEARGTAQETLTVFCSDHGEHLGQHRMYQKMECYEAALRVPMIIRWPGGARGPCDTPVSHLDLLPTVLDWAGLPAPPELAGRSLRPLLTGQCPLPDRPVFSLYAGNAGLGDQRRSVVTRQWKYIWDPASVAELYDLVADPLEMRNLASDPAHARQVAELHALLRAQAHAQGDWLQP